MTPTEPRGSHQADAATRNRLISALALEQFGVAVLEAVNTPSDAAAEVSRALVEADLAGHGSHGVMRLPSYVSWVGAGEIVPDARPIVVRTTRSTTAHVDGAWGWGQPAARLAADTAVGIAQEWGMAAVSAARCNHVGRLGDYVERVAAHNMIALAVCNTNVLVAPYGGRERLLGSNPIAFACPRADGAKPVSLDIATAAMPYGKLLVALARGESLAPGLLIDRDGAPTTDPAAFDEGGALLPFGGHKGYGLSLLVEILGGILSGGGAACSERFSHGNGLLLIALDIDAMLPSGDYQTDIEELCERLAGSAPAIGHSKVVIPGEPETSSAQQARRDGVALPVATRTELIGLARELDIAADGL